MLVCVGVGVGRNLGGVCVVRLVVCCAFGCVVCLIACVLCV